MEYRVEVKVPLDKRGAELPSRSMLRFYMELAAWLKIHPFTDVKLDSGELSFIKESLQSKQYESLKLNLPKEAYEYWRRVHYLDRWIVLVTVIELGERYKERMLVSVDTAPITEQPTKTNEPIGETSSKRHTEQIVEPNQNQPEETHFSNPKIDGEENEAEPESSEEDDLRDLVPGGLFQT